jgi:FtsP/CotA-like multicopper oxidase with cupredoxin domain
MPSGMWRDTVFIPPFGYTIIQSRFGESKGGTGKTVYHCHFLDHEDQGMIAALINAGSG